MSGAIAILDSIEAPVSGEVSLTSRVAGPIEKLSFLRRSLLFAELSEIAYFSRAEAGRLANRIGFPETRFYDRNGAQAYIFGNPYDAVVTCRGTEPNDWNDLRADLTLSLVVAETVGRVHRGFKHQIDDLWPRLEQALVNNRRPVWFTGHSLGAAMATICAGRCKVSYVSPDPRALFTYGSPRVGTGRYVHYVNIEAFRWVNNNDIVTRVPPPWLGYRHKGEEVYLNAYGQIRRLTAWQRCKDRWRGFARGLRRWEFDHFADHAIGRYVEYIRRAVEEEEAVIRWQAPRPGAEPTPRRMAA